MKIKTLELMHRLLKKEVRDSKNAAVAANQAMTAAFPKGPAAGRDEEYDNLYSSMEMAFSRRDAADAALRDFESQEW